MGHVKVGLHLRHEVDATSRMGLGLGGVGWGMLRLACTFVMKLMPDKIASKCRSKPNPLLWKYIRSAQWRWEMNSADLLAKMGLYLAKL